MAVSRTFSKSVWVFHHRKWWFLFFLIAWTIAWGRTWVFVMGHVCVAGCGFSCCFEGVSPHLSQAACDLFWEQRATVFDCCVGQLSCAARFYCAVEATDHGDRGRARRNLVSFLKRNLSMLFTITNPQTLKYGVVAWTFSLPSGFSLNYFQELRDFSVG